VSSVKSENFMKVIAFLHSEGITYMIPWGFESLPDENHGGDIDMCVSNIGYPRLADELKRQGYSAHPCPYYSKEHRHAQFARTDRYSLHIFDSFCFVLYGKPMLLTIDHQVLLWCRCHMRGMWVANPVLEMLFTCLRVMGGRTDCIKRLKKYVKAIK